jgi:hypothetical protein
MTGAAVTERDIEDSANDGAICLLGAFDTRWIAMVARDIDKEFRRPRRNVHAGELRTFLPACRCCSSLILSSDNGQHSAK